MIDRLQRIHHNGKEILIADFSRLSADELPAILRQVAVRIAAEPLTSVRLITFTEGARFGVGTVEDVKLYSRTIRPALKASAVVGLSALQSVVYMAAKPFLHSTVTPFDDFETAKDWLASHP
jgi:hypothetical protein